MEELRVETQRWHEALREHTICMMKSTRRHTQEWRGLYDELLAAYAAATRRLAEFEEEAMARARSKAASPTQDGVLDKDMDKEKAALECEVSALRGRLKTAELELREASLLEESFSSEPSLCTVPSLCLSTARLRGAKSCVAVSPPFAVFAPSLAPDRETLACFSAEG